jgi:hypothetical protein
MSRPANREGGTKGYQTGNLRFKLDAVIPFLFSADYPVTTGIKTERLLLRGLSSLLNVQIHVAIRPADGMDIPAYSALPGTVQVTPFAKTKDGGMLFLKPLELVPQTIPHQFNLGGPSRQGGSGALSVGGDFGTSGGDGALIEVVIDPADYAAGSLEGALNVFVEADYNGQWWDIDAIQTLFGQLALSGNDPTRIHTAVE